MRFRIASIICALSLAWASLPASADTTKKLLIVGDKPDGHPPETHEFMRGGEIMVELFKDVPGVSATLIDGQNPWPEGPEKIRDADAVVLFVSEGGKWVQADPRRYEALTQLAARGGGISALHWGIGAKDAKYIKPYQKLIGGIHGGPDRKHRVLTTKISPAQPEHFINRGIAPFKVKDEFYYKLKFSEEGKITPLLDVEIDSDPQTVAWAWDRPDEGRSFGFSGLHFHKNWQIEPYRKLVKQGVLWTLKQDTAK